MKMDYLPPEIEEEVKVLLSAIKQRNQKKKELGLSLSSYLRENKIKNVFWNLLESSGENSTASVLKLSPELKQRAIDEITQCEKLFPDAPGLGWLLTFKKNLTLKTKSTNKSFVEEIYSLENMFFDQN